jgi:3-deoxy-D-manno-octulosonate cytidylyltransferase
MVFKVVIPARYNSTRLPGKPLIEIGGIPMVIHVAQRASLSGAKNVVIATDDEKIAEVVRYYNFKSVMTNKNHLSGTDRCLEASEIKKWDGQDIIVNVQADEPLIDPLLIDLLAKNIIDGNSEYVTACSKFKSYKEFINPNNVKVVVDIYSHALYFSRSAIPYSSSADLSNNNYKSHSIMSIGSQQVTQQTKPPLSFWQIWNVSFGFLGVQFGFALQNANASRILSDLGADLHSLSLFWLVAPIMGLLIQPLVGSASDKTWNRLGRRTPYILIGAIAAAVGMILMPNSPLFVSIITPIFFGVMMLAIMDASFNVAFQPFRALVSDMVPANQRNIGYSVQSFLINIGAVIGSILPFVLTNIIGLDNTANTGEVAPSVIWAFYIGASVLLGSVLWTVFKTKEYAPGEYGLAVIEPRQQKNSISEKFIGFLGLVKTMPKVMKQLALVQFFSWFALFIMWVYTMPALAQHIWGIEAKWFDPAFLSQVDNIRADLVD